MSKKLPVDGFRWKKKKSRLTQNFEQNYDDGRDKEYIFQVDVGCPKRLQKIYSDLTYLYERKKIEKSQRLICNMYDNKNYIVHIKTLKLALYYRLILEKLHRVIKLNQEA